jgi:hypothetical protein
MLMDADAMFSSVLEKVVNKRLVGSLTKVMLAQLVIFKSMLSPAGANLQWHL